MSDQSKTAASHRVRLAVTVRQEDGYWFASAGKLDSYGTGDTPATAVESCLEEIIVRARMFREERASLGNRRGVSSNGTETYAKPSSGTANRSTG